MSTLILELPDEQMRALEHVAQRRGTDVRAFVAELIGGVTAPQTLIAGAEDVPYDSIYNIRSHETAAPADLSKNADEYLYGAAGA